MKKLAISLALALVAPAAFGAQLTCASHGAPITGPVNLTAQDTCGGTTEFANLCGNQHSPGPTNVYELTVGASNGFTITLTQTDGTYDSALWLVGPGVTCLNPTTCQAKNDANGAGNGTTETLGSGEGLTTNIGAGTYFLVVGSTAGASQASGGCGTYGLAISGSLPVKLNKFAID